VSRYFSCVRTIDIKGDPAQVFEILMNGGPGWTIEPEIGGRFRIDQERLRVSGVVAAYDPPHGITFSWKFDGGESESIVRADVRRERGRTIVTIVHGGCPTPEFAERMRDGWSHFLEDVKAVAEGRTPAGALWAPE
jgi:uncharacterized protein YndB with AHSA1/START domain